MSSFNFKIIVGIMFSPSLVSRFKEKIILETSVLSVEIIKNGPVLKGVRQLQYYILLENMMKD